MKFQTVIIKLQNFHDAYVKKHNCKPEIWDIDILDFESIEINLVSAVKRENRTRYGLWPRMTRKIYIGNRVR